jgi:hypothetical protein
MTKLKPPPVRFVNASRSNTNGKDAMDRSKLAFIDIDHSIADAAWRDSLMGSWDEYHAKSIDDRPIDEMIALVDSLFNDQWVTIGLTGRPEKFRQLTETWLLKQKLQLDELIMRPNEVYDGAAVFKTIEVIDRCSKEINPTVLVFDDRDDVIGAMKASGIKCVALQVHAGANSYNERPKYVSE